MKTYFITIHSFNEKTGTFYEQQIQADSKQDIARVFLTFKPKRGYTPVNYIIDVFTKPSGSNKSTQIELEL